MNTSGLINQIVEMGAHVKRLQAENESLNNALENSQGVSALLEESLKYWLAEYDVENKRHLELSHSSKRDYANLLAENNHLQAEIMHKDDLLSDSNERSNRWKARYQAMNEENKRLQVENDQVTRDINAFGEHIDLQENNIRALQLEKYNLEEENERLNTVVLNLDNSVAYWVKQVKLHEEKIQEYREENERLNMLTWVKEQAINTQGQTIKKQVGELEAAQMIINALIEEVNSQVEEIQRLHNVISKWVMKD